MKNFLKALYFTSLLYFVVSALVSLLVLSFFFPAMYEPVKYSLLIIAGLFLADILILFSNKKGFFARRDTMDKLSNGDDNSVKIFLENRYLFPVKLEVIDELPFQFQSRNLKFRLRIGAGRDKTIEYKVRPVKRGEYQFGAVNIYASNPIGFVQRRFRFSQDMMVPVYPSFMQMRRYELLAISNRLTEAGVKKIRKIGRNTEFEQIKDYVAGDDYRTVNWKATARRNKLMVNQYQDERSQQVYSIIDMGRVMRMPFEELSLLDYAINSSLIISNVALMRHDKAGVLTFSNKVQAMLPAERKGVQLQKILQLLYNQKTGYLESNYEALYAQVKTKISQRSLLLLYTNFESLSGMQRQLKYLKRIATSHLLVVVFFENTELKKFLNEPAANTEDIYNKTIADKFAFEKKLIVRELEKYGIHSILTAPKNLTVNTINKYLELKSRGLI